MPVSCAGYLPGSQYCREFSHLNSHLVLLTAHFRSENWKLNWLFNMPRDVVYCFCRTNKKGFMIFCDNCEEWYHGACLNIREGMALPNEWFCPLCCRLRSLERRLSDQIMNLRAAMTEELESSAQKNKDIEEQIGNQLRERVGELQAQLVSARNQIKILEEEKAENLKSSSALILTHAAEIKHLKDEHAKALHDLKSKHELDVHIAQREASIHSEELNKQISSAKGQIQMLLDEKAKSIESINVLKSNHAAAIKELKRKRSAPLQLKTSSQPIMKKTKPKKLDSFSEDEKDAFVSLK